MARRKFNSNSHTAEWLRKMGWSVDYTERPATRFTNTKDLFGCIDLIALKAGRPKLAVQATAARNPGGQAAARVRKILSIPEAKLWIEDGSYLWVVCWVFKDRRWEPDIRPITKEMFKEK